MSQTIMPGATIGVLGSGQLGRMFTIAARRLGYRVHVFSPDDDTPTGQVADVEIQSGYDNLDAVASFASGVDVVTFEFENVPADTLDTVHNLAPVRPGGLVLHTTQQRIREKTFLQQAGIPVAPFRIIRAQDELQSISADELPGVLKTAAWGYDGKGQAKVHNSNELQSAWTELNCQEAVLERFIDFSCEFSIVAARGCDGDVVTYGPVLNEHRHHILDVSIVPAGLPAKVAADAIEITRTVLTRLDVTGVLCVEFFLASDGQVLVNEVAPRPHNSGHVTIDAFSTCQFEQQVRAVCGLPLGAAIQLRPAAMVNLLGDTWAQGEPDWRAALAVEGLSLHLYGKKEARAGRKMGHMTVLADTSDDAAAKVRSARQLLQPSTATNR